MNKVTGHSIDRVELRWLDKKTNSRVSIANLSNKHLMNIKELIQNEKPGVWNGYTSENWVNTINAELALRNQKVDVVINTAIEMVKNAPSKSLENQLKLLLV